MKSAVDVDDAGLEAATAAGDVLVCFHDDTGDFAAVVRRAAYGLARTLGDRAEVLLAGRGKCPNAFERFGVTTAPTYVLFRDGRRVASTVGFQQEPELVALIDRNPPE